MSTSDPTTTKGDPNLAAIGDNSGAEERHFAEALRAQVKLNEKRQALNAEISAARKGFKANGVSLGHLDSVLRMIEWEPGAVRDFFETQSKYARWARLPVGTQIDLLAHAEDEEISAEDWKSRGWGAAVTGKGTFGVPPEDCPGEHVQDWMQGWTDGQHFNAPGQLQEA